MVRLTRMFAGQHESQSCQSGGSIVLKKGKALFFRCSFACLIALCTVVAAPLAVAQAAAQSASADNLKVVLLGTGVGPQLNLQQFGESTLIEAGSVRLLFDCGRGTTLRLAE